MKRNYNSWMRLVADKFEAVFHRVDRQAPMVLVSIKDLRNPESNQITIETNTIKDILLDEAAWNLSVSDN